MPKLIVLAFLQNQWFQRPHGVERIYAQHAGDYDHLAKLDAAYLFMGCLTGRRLKNAFGTSARHDIIWQNASPKIAGKSNGVFPADVPHMLRIIEHFQPKIVIGFGSVAVPPLRRMKDAGAPWHFVQAPHPAARHATVPQELADAARRVREFSELEATHA